MSTSGTERFANHHPQKAELQMFLEAAELRWEDRGAVARDGHVITGE